MGSFSFALCFCMAKPARRRRPSMAGVGATPFVDARPNGENRVEAHDNVMRQTILGLVSNWVGSLWSTGSRTTGEPSGGLLSERQGGILGHMSVDESSSEEEDVVCVGESNVFFGVGLREYIPHLLPLDKLERGIDTMVSPVDGVAGTCGETHADLDEGVSSELVETYAMKLRSAYDSDSSVKNFSQGFCKPKTPARFLTRCWKRSSTPLKTKSCDSLTEVAEPECGLVSRVSERLCL
ncbi:hypothetical protein J3Q64DRAFT_1832990 [Phycomyces blakesleeanus]|uniref:Uncharacterized protein n=1 Tax=Phycomyces blakesleeanus TaxID=4837 RepID=A0ABR3B1P8_PHYBL